LTHGFPQCQEQGCEIAGFVWWQGHKDGNPAHASRYEQNLVGEALGRGMVELLDHSMISGLRRGGERDEGHTGNSFNMLWAMPGVALSGRPDLSAQTSPNIRLKETESRITTEARAIARRSDGTSIAVSLRRSSRQQMFLLSAAFFSDGGGSWHGKSLQVFSRVLKMLPIRV
jgi:hypothetical protein